MATPTPEPPSCEADHCIMATQPHNIRIVTDRVNILSPVCNATVSIRLDNENN